MQKNNNLQEIFLTKARKQSIPLTIFLMNGFQLRGVVTGFDCFTVVLDTALTEELIREGFVREIISKLQTMIANHEIDAIVATPKTFKQLSGYGYLTNLDSSLTKRQRTLLSGDFVTMKGFKDSDDPDFEGGGKGKAEPFGLSMTDFRQWNRLKSAKSNALIGIVRESPNPTTAQRLIDYLSA